MTSPSVGWLLTLEPIGDDVAYSLIRDDGNPVLREAAVLTELQRAKEQARQLIPTSTHVGGLWGGPLAHPASEVDAAVMLGEALLPASLRRGLLAADASRTTLTVATRGWLASVPWEALSLTYDGSVRVVERARVLGGLSPAIAANRAVTAPPSDPRAPGLAIVDPGPPVGTPQPLFPAGYPTEITGPGGIECVDLPTEAGVSTADLTALLLRRHLSRLFYFGHVLAAPSSAPSTAALVLSLGRSLDLLTARAWIAEPHRWPVPERVALIGCTGSDTIHREQSGLVVAALNAGAQVVTTTRWLLPADVKAHGVRGTSLLGIAVYHAHQAEDVGAALRTWQAAELDIWRKTGHPAHAPLLWASLVTFSVG